MKANQVYALIAVPCSIQSGGPLTFSNTYGGSYNPLSDLSYVNGGFLKSSTDVLVTVTKKSFKQLTDPIQSYKSLIYRDKPSYYWSLDEVSGTIAVDQIGNANGTISGGVTLNQSGAVGKGMLFDGVDDRIVIPLASLLSKPFGTGPITLECWIKTNTPQVFKRPCDFKFNGTNDPGIGFLSGGTGQMYVEVKNGTTGITVGAIVPFADNNWHHLVGVVTRGTPDVTRFYFDGVFIIDGGSISGSLTPISDCGIGAAYAGQEPWAGLIDEVAIYPYALSPQQISSHYLAKSVPPNSYASAVMASNPTNYWQLDEEGGLVANDLVGGKHGTISGGVTLAQSGIGKSMLFNGTTGWAGATSTLVIPQTATLEAWVKNTGLVTFGTIFSNRANGDTGNIWFGTSGTFKPAIYSGANSIEAATPLVIGQWYHIVGVLTNNIGRIYINGVLSIEGPLPKSPNLVGNWAIGVDGTPAGTLWWSGNIDEVAIYNRALSASEILAHYNARPVPTQIPYQDLILSHGVVNYWRFSETSGQVLDHKGTVHGTVNDTVYRGEPGVLSDDFALRTDYDTGGGWVDLPSYTLPITHSIELWSKSPVTNSTVTLWTNRSYAISTNVYFGFNMGKISYGANAVGPALESPLRYDDNQWHHIVATSSAAGSKIYVDGVLVVSNAVSMIQTIGTAMIGKDNFTGVATATIDELAIYHKELTPAEILEHYQAR